MQNFSHTTNQTLASPPDSESWELDYYQLHSNDQELDFNTAANETIPTPKNNACSIPATTSSPVNGKQKRRRSSKAASARMATTFLNANVTNFRALVQQHTGSRSHSNKKGPITLCFDEASSYPAVNNPPNHNQPAAGPDYNEYFRSNDDHYRY